MLSLLQVETSREKRNLLKTKQNNVTKRNVKTKRDQRIRVASSYCVVIELKQLITWANVARIQDNEWLCEKCWNCVGD